MISSSIFHPQSAIPLSRLLITSGPTRQYLDPVRYLTNASSGRMGRALAEAALELGHQVIVVSGPVEIEYPVAAEVIPVVSTEGMMTTCESIFPGCDGMIGVAAPCDYRPERVESSKISKTGGPLMLRLVETDDVVAKMAAQKKNRWVVGFALETDDARLRALAKMERKSCDLMVLNGAEAMNALATRVEIIDAGGQTVARSEGPKEQVARDIFRVIQQQLISD